MKDNIGYGAACNFARKNLKTKYFCLFNPDIKIIDGNLFESFYLAAKKLKNKFLGIGPSYQRENRLTNHKIIKRVKTISGACMFINCKAFDEIGGFDENIFLYFEEKDLCKRGNN